MYIPISFLGGSNFSPISASGGDFTGFFQTGSAWRNYHRFTTTGSASFIIHDGFTNEANILVVGGGGTGGFSQDTYPHASGGGGGGVVLVTNTTLIPRTYDLYVGAKKQLQPSGPGNQIVPYSGLNSWIDIGQTLSSGSYPYQYDQTFASESQSILGAGGGRGAYRFGTPALGPQSGGSGGGAFTTIGYSFGPANGIDGQGFIGGELIGLDVNDGGAGGGGADGTGGDFNRSSSTKGGAGGEGRPIDMYGKGIIYYGCGGPGMYSSGVPRTPSPGDLPTGYSTSVGRGGGGTYSRTAVIPYLWAQHEDPTHGTIIITYPMNIQNVPIGVTKQNLLFGYINEQTGSTFQLTGSFYDYDLPNGEITMEIWSKNSEDANYDSLINVNNHGAYESPVEGRVFLEIRQLESSSNQDYIFGNYEYIKNGSTVEQYQTLPVSSSVSTTEWYHNTLSWSSTDNMMYYYRNSVLIGSQSVILSSSLENPWWGVGIQDDGSNENVYVGEFRYYSQKLTQEEIESNYSASLSRYI